MLKRIRIQITTERRTCSGSLFAPIPALVPIPQAETTRTDFSMAGRWHDDGERITLSYEETEASGLEGSTTSISYRKSEPNIISMLRNGMARTSLTFETGRRHETLYQTPIMPFTACVATRGVQNALESEGALILDYDIELRGAEAERTHFVLRVLPDFQRPQKKV